MSQYKFACTQCGQCCREPGFVFFDESEQAAAGKLFNMSGEAFRERFLVETEIGWAVEVPDDSACVFLLDSVCTIPSAKPRQCRTYPFWPEISGDFGRWLAEGRQCPGIGQGRVYSESERRALEREESSTDENH